MGFCFEAGADEDTHFRATSLETLRNMVAAGSGITLLPALAVPQERKRDGVVYIPCIKPEPRRTIGLVYRLVRHCVAAMSIWRRPSAVLWMATSIRR